MVSVCFWSKTSLHVCSFQLCPVGILFLSLILLHLHPTEHMGAGADGLYLFLVQKWSPCWQLPAVPSRHFPSPYPTPPTPSLPY